MVAALLVLLIVGLLLSGIMLGSRNRSRRHSFRPRLRAGAPIVYRVLETSTCPSLEAREVYPSEHGDSYCYLTEKYWRVEEVLPDGWLVVRTTLMERLRLRRDDPNLRHANLIERVRHAARFPVAA